VFCLSDLHVDQGGGANLRWLQRISTHKFQQDVLLVAGGWVGVKEGRWGGGGAASPPPSSLPRSQHTRDLQPAPT
jgi:hypothetical protein